MKLEGLKVVDLSWFLPGPFLTMALADHGAEVIKVEPPSEGDPGRHIAPIYDLAQALDAPFTQRSGMVRSIPHPTRSELRVLANPLKFNGVRPAQRACSALGADNDAILAQERAGA